VKKNLLEEFDRKIGPKSASEWVEMKNRGLKISGILAGWTY